MHYHTSIKTSTRFNTFHLIYEKEELLPIEAKLPTTKELEQLLGSSKEAFKEIFLQLQEVQFNGMNSLEHY